MSDVSQGVGWWQASDGRWYPPKESEEAPEPGWWLAADGRWYAPVESTEPPEPGWWLAADGRWYPPESIPGDQTDDPAYQPRRLDDTGVEAEVDADPDAEVESRVEPATETAAHDLEGDVDPEVTAVADHPVAHGPTDEHAADEVHPHVAAPQAADPAEDPGQRHVQAVADRPPRTVEEASTRAAAARPRPEDASQQIRRRDDASREDAIAQASARFMAASRALKFLEADIEDNREHPGMSAARSTARAAQDEVAASTSRPPDASAEVGSGAETETKSEEQVKAEAWAEAKAQAKAQVKSGADAEAEPEPESDAEAELTASVESEAEITSRAEVEVDATPVGPAAEAAVPDVAVAEAPSPPPAAPPQPPRSARSGIGNPEDLLIELRTSPLGADIDHIGDRILVFVDRVELRDRNDRIRQVLLGEDITDVVVQRKFTGAVLSVESGSGDSIVTRGLKPEQADQARLVIHKRTRAGRPVTPKQAEKSRGNQRPNPSVNGPKPPDMSAPSADAVAAAAARLAILNRERLNEADLLRKLADLHRAGVLTDIEFEEKIALVGRLVSGETLVVS